jgi:hypothetical protein
MDPQGALRRPKPLKCADWDVGRGALRARVARSETEAAKRFARAQRAGAWSSPRRICRRPRPSTTSHSDFPDGCPFTDATSRARTEARARSATPGRGRGARLPVLTRPPPTEAGEDHAHANARTGCPFATARPTAAGRSQQRSDWRQRTDGCPCATVTSRAPTEVETRAATPTRGRGARLPPLTRPPPAEANGDRAHDDARTGCPLAAAHTTAASRSQRRPSSR